MRTMTPLSVDLSFSGDGEDGYNTQTHKVPGDENYHSQWISGDGEEEHGKWRTKGDEGAAKKLHDRHDGSFSIPER